MGSSLFVLLLAASFASASPLGKRVVDNTQSYGTNPLSIASVKFLGTQTSDNSCTQRDLGFTGKIHDEWYGVYGDTLYCAAGVTNPSKTDYAFNGMVRDSVALMTDNVLKAHDLNLNDDSPVPHPNQFIPYNASWGETSAYGFGGTSLCETDYDASEGVVFYVVNANDAGLKGSGVGRVKVTDGQPKVVERYGDSGWWWDCENHPRYGDVAAYRDLWSDYIYAYGGAPSSQTGYVDSSYAYLARVKASDAFDLSKYQYWYGRDQKWSSTPLTTFTSETAVLWDVGQGQIVWNAHHSVYIFVYLTPGGNEVALRTAHQPEGPWSSPVMAYEVTDLSLGGMAYAGVAHPYLDKSGKTLTVSYTNSPNDIEAIEITFD